MDTKDSPTSDEKPESPQEPDPKSKDKDSGAGKTNSNNNDISAKVGGQDNDAIVVGGSVSGSVQIDRSEHYHYHFDGVDYGKVLQEGIASGKKRKKKHTISRPSGEKNKEWLDSLDEYGRYYIVAVCFYYGLKVSDFREVLNNIKNHLSPDAKKSFSYQHPKIETVEKYDTQSMAITIKLPDDKFVDQVLNLIQEHYSYLFFNFIPILREIVETQPKNWEVRWRSAVALGQISEIDVTHVFNAVIDPWATDERAYVRATVGYYYYYFFGAMELFPEGAQKFLLDKLALWANPKNFRVSQWRYKWTVAATCEKIGLLEQGDAKNIADQYLEKVAGVNHLRVADSVIHVYVEWSLKKKFRDVILLLTKWAEAGSAGDHDEDNPYQIRCVVALLAFSAVIEVNYDLLDEQENKDEYIFPIDVLQVILDTKSGDQQLWNGVVSIGIRYFDFRMSHFFFAMVENWAKIIPDKDLYIEFVSSWLAEIYFNVRSRIHLENRMKNVWVKGKNKTLQTAAEKVQQKIKKVS